MNLRTIILLGMIAIGLSACASSDGDDPLPTGNQTSTGTGAVSGLVTDANSGVRLSGVAVKVGTQETTTDSNGEFVIENLTNSDYVLSFAKTNYAPGYGNVTVNDSSEAMLLSLKKEGTRQDYDSSTEATLYEETTNGPYAVIFQPNTLDTSDTDLKVSVTPLDPTLESEALPGQLETETAMLVPLTFAEFSIYDSAGNIVNLKSGEEAVVELPIPVSLRGLPEYSLGKTIHCYSYNPATGEWEDFVVGTIVESSIDGETPVVRASIKHFSWYGAAPQSSDCVDIYGQVVSAATGQPLPNARVEAFPGSATTSDANGNFQLTTSASSTPKITASRTFTDTDGSISGTPGARVIEFGSVVDIPLVGLVSRPCSDQPGSNPNGQTSDEPGSPTNPIEVSLGNLGEVSYSVVAYLTENSIIAILTTNVGDSEVEDDGVGNASLVLSGPNNESITLSEIVTGYYSADLVTSPGQRYTLTIDADSNGTIDGSGSVFMNGEVTFTNPTEGQTVNKENLNISWHDSALDSAALDPSYSVVYWVWLFGTGTDGDQFNFDNAEYMGTNLNFVAKSKSNEGQDLKPGNYSASVWSISGAYEPSSNDFDVSIINNIKGPSVNGQFYVFDFTSDTINFTVQ